MSFLVKRRDTGRVNIENVVDYGQLEVTSMNTQQPGPNVLILEIDGPQITANKFRKGINAFLDVIDEVVKEMSGSKKAVRWIVSVNAGSLQVALEAQSVSKKLPPHEIPIVLEKIQNGLHMIEKGEKKPPYFNDTALLKARELASIANGKRRQIDSIKVRRNEQVARVTTKTLANVDSFFGTASTAWGSVEGRLSIISERGGLNITVYDDVSEKYIRCNVPEQILEDILAAYRKRVSVSGEIRYFPNGDIKDIAVENFELFPDPNTLPDFEDLFGMFRKAE